MVRKGNIPWNKGKTASEETRRKLSLSHLGKSSWINGKTHSKETKRKISEANKGRHHSEEARQKISLALKGRTTWNKGKFASEETKRKMSETNKRQALWTGRHHSEESKRKMSESHLGQIPWIKGKHWSEEMRKKLSESHKGKPAWNKGKKTGKPSWMKGKHHTPESNKKNSESHKGQIAWNKGKHTGLVPWNKGKQGTLHHSEEAKLKIKENRAKQIFPIKDSLPEIKIQNFLRQLGITFLAHKHIKEIKHGYQCDILIPSMNLIIESDGDYWHGNIDNPRFKILNKSQMNTKDLDNIRTKELIEKGFKVLRLWESDIKKMNLKDFMERIKPLDFFK